MTTPTAPRVAARTPRRRVLMCPPDFFSVDYAINPWMEGNQARPNLDEARRQWKNLRDRVAERADVVELPPERGLPDLVFTANAALLCGQKAVLSSFRHPERQGEEPVNRRFLQSMGFKVLLPPDGVAFEGAGDALFDRGTERLWMGYGFRTDLETAGFLEHELDTDVVPLHLVDERFYHLDTCFCPLEDGYLVYYPPAFSERSQRLIAERIPAGMRHEVSERDAVNFACNAINVGPSVILNRASDELRARLEGWGFEVVESPLSEFILSGGSAKCLSLILNQEPPSGRAGREPGFARRTIRLTGHLLDSGLLARAMDLITESGGSFEVLELRAGLRKGDSSTIRLEVHAASTDDLERLLGNLVECGAEVEDRVRRSAVLAEVQQDGVAPEDFYATTIFPTDILIDGKWHRALHQRMDGVLVAKRDGGIQVDLIRNLRRGDRVVVGIDGVRITVPEQESHSGQFQFGPSKVSTERRLEPSIESIAWEMLQIHGRNGRVVFVPGPVVVHTGGVPATIELVRRGHVQAVLSGNALAVHDIERALFGTSMGVDLKRGVTVDGGHRHPLAAINLVRRFGSIPQAVESGILTEGLMAELVRTGVPYCLAGSIRDDGPLPDTLMDLKTAQARYAELLTGVDMVVMMGTMLHSMAVVNMIPAGVKIACVDINPGVAGRLADRGSLEAIPVVSDAGLFLNLLVRKLEELSK